MLSSATDQQPRKMRRKLPVRCDRCCITEHHTVVPHESLHTAAAAAAQVQAAPIATLEANYTAVNNHLSFTVFLTRATKHTGKSASKPSHSSGFQPVWPTAALLYTATTTVAAAVP
jgi:hypothetical protein